MSWYRQLAGKGPALVEKIEKDFGATEEQCKGFPSEAKVVSHVKSALLEIAQSDPERVYSIKANGSVSNGTHSLEVKVEALHDFAG